MASGMRSMVSKDNAPSMVSDCLRNIDVAILAGGLGTRISPELGSIPKILAPIGERTYLMFLLSWLKYFGVRRIVFGLGHLAGAVLEYLEKNPVKNIDIECVVEERPLGTAGAIANMRSEISTSPVLIMNGDSFVDINLCEFIKFHQREKTEASIVCADLPEAARYGAVQLDNNNRIIQFLEKKRGVGQGLINAGIYLFEQNIIAEIGKNGPSLERDFFYQQPAGRLAGLRSCGVFLDIGTPEDLARAPEILSPYYN